MPESLHQVKIELDRFAVSTELEGQVGVVEGSINSVDCRMMIWTNQNHVAQMIIAAPDEPMNMMALTKRMAVVLKGMPHTNLATTSVQVLQLLD
jgi:hypothetical protein